ncbi:MAG: family 78 glycoside hydrolase catalytic domain [Clostridiales bacterium]|nr:family 78 glycoside hydrolase catalytic domain [Clostridiales bacterium]
MSLKEAFNGAFWIGIPDEQYKLRNKINGIIGTKAGYFKNSFTLNEKAQLKINISANSRYRIWINGRAVTSGPCKGDRFRKYYDTVDVSEFLKSGANVVAVKVVDYIPYEASGFADNGPTSIVTNAAGIRFILGGVCKGADGRELCDISTGKSDWKVYLDEAITWVPSPITAWMGSMESVDGSLLPYGWKEKADADNTWSSAKVIEPAEGSPWAALFGIIPALPLTERPIPLLYEKERTFVSEMDVKSEEFNVFNLLGKEEAELKPRCKYVIELNAGELTTGYFNLKVGGGRGSKITIKYTEAYSKEVKGKGRTKGVRDDNKNYDFIGCQDIYYPSGNEETYEPFWFRTFRFVRIEVETGEEALYIKAPVYYENGYPLKVKTEVHSSAEWINALWDISLRTLRRCMHETYEDCPYYEQLQYAMDTRIQILFSYMVSGDTRLARKAIEDYASSLIPEGILQSRYPSAEPQIIPTFALYWIMIVDDYYLQTGDKSVVKKYRSIIDTVLNWYDDKIGGSGLIEKLGYWEFIDWVKQWDKGVPDAVKYGPSTTHNFIYAYALKVAAGLNRACGRDGIADEYENRAADIINRVNELCFCEKDNLYKEGPSFEGYSVQAQLWAVLSKAASGEKAKAILRKSLSMPEIPQCSYVMSFFLFRALEEAGIYEDTEKLWDMWKKLIGLNLTTVPEDPVQPRSDCHAWGALPLFEFTTNLLGVKPGAPGWEEIILEPKTLSLRDMKGTVVTPKGPVKVEWNIKDDKFNIYADLPKGVPCMIKLPDGNNVKLCNGGVFRNF